MDCRLSLLAPRVLVSEYQYYDFRAIDHPLTTKEMAGATFHLHAGRNYRYELHEPLRMERPESQSEQANRKVFRRFLSTSRTGGRMSSIFASRRNRSTTSCSRRWSLAGACRCEKPRDS